MYKDKEKQREKTRERVRRYRALQKGVTDGSNNMLMTPTPIMKPRAMRRAQKEKHIETQKEIQERLWKAQEARDRILNGVKRG